MSNEHLLSVQILHSVLRFNYRIEKKLDQKGYERSNKRNRVKNGKGYDIDNIQKIKLIKIMQACH
jgi:hypothetical protein